jgi:hypothetical protein
MVEAQILIECTPHPYDMCGKCFSTFKYYGWVYGSTLTLLSPVQVGGELSGFGGRDLRSLREQLSPITPNLPHHPEEDYFIHNFIYIR